MLKNMKKKSRVDVRQLNTLINSGNKFQQALESEEHVMIPAKIKPVYKEDKNEVKREINIVSIKEDNNEKEEINVVKEECLPCVNKGIVVNTENLNKLLCHLKSINILNPSKMVQIPLIIEDKTKLIEINICYITNSSEYVIGILDIDKNDEDYYILYEKSDDLEKIVKSFITHINCLSICKCCERVFAFVAYPTNFLVNDNTCMDCLMKNIFVYDSDDKCSICSNLVKTNRVLTPCKHYYHLDCLISNKEEKCNECDTNLTEFISTLN